MSNNKPISRKMSFWELIFKTKIEIPIIQRDYAQGREDKWEIRNGFLKALHSAIKQGNPIELDFIYGSNNLNCLQPLDGQQRLTTLFLLHWYISFKENVECSIKDILKGFTYETRTSSREFCNELVEKGIDFKNLVNVNDNQISKSIIDSSWFFLSWEKDPTIKSMLTMLDAIHNEFQGTEHIWETLTSKSIITFQYIELENFGLSDDLYIKMNARGKPLTEFENFKAKFEQHINNNHLSTKNTFSKNIDGKWTDLFWNYRDNETDLFDEKFMTFFKVMATNHFAVKNKLIKDFTVDITLLRSNKYLTFSKYVDLKVFDEAYTNQIIQVLNKLSDGCNGTQKTKKYLPDSPYINEEEQFVNLINDKLGYPEMVIFYAYAQFLNIADSLDINNEKFENWMRVIRNLVEGSRLIYYNDAIEYANSIEAVNKLLKFKDDILNYFINVDDDVISGFSGIQIDEERLKAKLFIKGNKWKTLITDIENHKYFNGQIDFILSFSGIKKQFENNINLDWTTEENEFYLNQLIINIEKAKAIFDDNGLIAFKDFTFERALLAKGDYLLSKGQNYSFLKNSERDISWKRLLRDDNNKREILYNLFNAVEIATIETDLQNIIAEYDEKNCWRYYFIKYSDIILNCGIDKLVRWNSDIDILLLETTTTGGYHREYYSFALFTILKKNPNINYSRARSIDYEKYFFIKDENCVKVSFVDGQYLIKQDGITILRNFDNLEVVLDYLKNDGFLSLNK